MKQADRPKWSPSKHHEDKAVLCRDCEDLGIKKEVRVPIKSQAAYCPVHNRIRKEWGKRI